MKINKKCRVLHLERNNPRHQGRLGAAQLGSCSAGRDLGVLLGTKLKVSPQGALAAGRFTASWAALGKASPAGQER